MIDIDMLMDEKKLKNMTIDKVYSLFENLSSDLKNKVINNKYFLERFSLDDIYKLLNLFENDEYFILLHNPYFLNKLSKINFSDIAFIFNSSQIFDLLMNDYFLDKLENIENAGQILDFFDNEFKLKLLNNSKLLSKLNLDGERNAGYLKRVFSRSERFQFLSDKRIFQKIKSQYLAYLSRDFSLDEKIRLLGNEDFTANLNAFSIMEMGKEIPVSRFDELDGKSIAALTYCLPHDVRYEIVYSKKVLNGDEVTRLVYDFKDEERFKIINDFFDKLSGKNIYDICKNLPLDKRMKIISNEQFWNKFNGDEISSLISDFNLEFRRNIIFKKKFSKKFSGNNIQDICDDFNYNDKEKLLNLFLEKLSSSNIRKIIENLSSLQRLNLLKNEFIFKKMNGKDLSSLVLDFDSETKFYILRKAKDKFHDIDLTYFVLNFSSEQIKSLLSDKEFIENIKIGDLISLLDYASDQEKLKILDNEKVISKLSIRNIISICNKFELKNRGELLDKQEIRDKIYKELSCNYIQNENFKKYFNAFGDKALDLIRKNPKEILGIVDSNNIGLLKEWFDKTGRKFIPPLYIVLNFPCFKASEFLSSQRLWHKILKTQGEYINDNEKAALMKFAYAFGVFDGNLDGFTKLNDILNKVPRYITKQEYGSLLNNEFFVYTLKDSLRNEGFDNFDNLSDIFKENNGKFTLNLNIQKYPKTMNILRNTLGNLNNKEILSLYKIFEIAYDFDFVYDREFYKFFLNNLNDILSEENIRYVSEIQKRFKKIKTVNSNRKLDLKVAIDYVKKNKYDNVIPGNEKLAKLSKIAGYSNEDFEVLQEIYNEGRKRVYSTIPRITGNMDDFRYEIVKLDDPLALTIGVMSDCCQKLHDNAETCMEHSMVSKDGRIFAIYDKEGNLVAQSWVWRNRDVLCFDNIEIPKRAFKRADGDREAFTNKVFNTYMKCARELFVKDEETYKKLYDNKKITKEEYDGLRLGKITIGLGYNDIASVIEKRLNKDEDILTRPISFVPPVLLNKSLYTMDSEIQYIALKRDDRIYYNGEALNIYHDVKEGLNLDDSSLKILKGIFKVDSETTILNKIKSYGISVDKVKLSISPNLIIIYEDDVDRVKVGRIFINNFFTDNSYYDAIVEEVRNSLEDISLNKKLDLSLLSEEENKVIDEAFSRERGYYRGK